MSRIINIYLGVSRGHFLPYYEVLTLVNSEDDFNIETCCLDFFSSNMLNKNCEVIVRKYYDQGKIVMSELFDVKTSGKYTNRFIREGHNLRKLLLAGEFNFV